MNLSRSCLMVALAALWICAAADARADEISLEFGGKVQTDIRFRPTGVGIGEYYNRAELGSGVSRNENIIKLKLNAAYGDIGAVAEVDLVFYGYNRELEGYSGLTLREDVDPFRIEAHSAYIEAYDLFIDGLDLRIGQQVITWGVGDQFNPTNTINPLDLEDPLLFGEQLGNMMVKVDYSFLDTWTISGVLVPVFKPALLPDSGKLGLADVSRLPFVSDGLRRRIHSEFALSKLFVGPTLVRKAIPVTPETSFENMQFAFRVAGIVLEQDIALSYYYGRTDMPQAYANISSQVDGKICNPATSASNPECVNATIQTDTYLGYPRVQVAGLNLSGQIPLDWISDKLTAIGYRLELGVFFPEEAQIALIQATAISIAPKGEYDYGKFAGDRGRPAVVADTPFAKWAFGLDYTISRNVYVNAQWVHGFPDEYGAGDFITEGWKVMTGGVIDKAPLTTCQLEQDGTKCAREWLRPRLGDYLVFGLDFRFLSDKLLLRMFTIWDMSGMHLDTYNADTGQRERTHYSMFTSEGFSAVLYPELNYTFGNGLELGAGALLMLGKEHTRFGDPAGGGHQIFTRARFSY